MWRALIATVPPYFGGGAQPGINDKAPLYISRLAAFAPTCPSRSNKAPPLEKAFGGEKSGDQRVTVKRQARLFLISLGFVDFENTRKGSKFMREFA